MCIRDSSLYIKRDEDGDESTSFKSRDARRETALKSVILKLELNFLKPKTKTDRRPKKRPTNH